MVEVVEEEVEVGRMEGVELLFLTDNSVAEVVYCRGNSSDEYIFAMLLQLV